MSAVHFHLSVGEADDPLMPWTRAVERVERTTFCLMLCCRACRRWVLSPETEREGVLTSPIPTLVPRSGTGITEHIVVGHLAIPAGRRSTLLKFCDPVTAGIYQISRARAFSAIRNHSISAEESCIS